MPANPLDENNHEQRERPLNVVSLSIIDQKSDDMLRKTTLVAARPKQLIDKISMGTLLEKFHSELSGSLDGKNTKWEAELELGIEFGVNVKAKIKLFSRD
jgi:hypothetical protein